MTPPSHLVNGFNPETRKLLDNGVMDLQEKNFMSNYEREKKVTLKEEKNMWGKKLQLYEKKTLQIMIEKCGNFIVMEANDNKKKAAKAFDAKTDKYTRKTLKMYEDAEPPPSIFEPD